MKLPQLLLLCLTLFSCGALPGCTVNHGSFDIQPFAPTIESQVPAKVAEAFSAKHPTGRIDQVEFRPWPQSGGGDHYRFTFYENGVQVQAVFRENGTEIRSKPASTCDSD